MAGNQSRTFKTGLDVYSVVRQIGCGGSGAVFEVKDSDGGHRALKLLTHASTSQRKRFKNEINFCSRPVSPRIVPVLDHGRSDDDSLFYVMPLYSSTLAGRMKLGIGLGEVLQLFSQILDGVEAAHLHGVYHRDLKPANLLYDAADQMVVADFGIAHFQEEDLLTLVATDSQERLANFRYSAPEQRTPGAIVDQRADIFALGLILNEMFTGHVPHGTGYLQIEGVAAAFGYLDALVGSMIQQRASERPQTIGKIKEDLVARGHQFVEFQRLETLKKKVVPESEVSDPLIEDPIRAVAPLGYDANALTLRLNREINPKWELCFRKRATAFTTNFSVTMISFYRDKATLTVTEHFTQSAVGLFKQYCNAANEEYADLVKREHQESRRRLRVELQRAKDDQERKIKLLGAIRL